MNLGIQDYVQCFQEKVKKVPEGLFLQSTIDLPGFDEKVKPYFDRWRRATAEDNAICEAQLQGQKLARLAMTAVWNLSKRH